MVRSVIGKVVSLATAAKTNQKKRRRPASRRLPLLVGFLISMATLMATATVALAVVFANTTSISIPSTGNSASPTSPASPYPSSITVSGLTGTVSDVNVSLRGLSHTWPDDVAVLLVGPGGQNVILMSDAGGGSDPACGGGSVSNVNLTFDDQAANQLPDSTQISSGTYRPTQGTSNVDCGNLRPFSFPAPAPSGPYGTTLSVFNGTAPNGTYSLYVVDDHPGEGGSISGGWSLDILTTTPPDTTPPNTTIASGPPSLTRSTSASFSFSSSEAGSTFQCSRDGSAFGGCTSPKSYSSLSQGNHTFRVRAIDKAGNTDATPASRSWFVDTVVPRGTISINGGRASTTSRSVTLKLSASDPAPASGVAYMRFRNGGSTTWSGWFAYSTSKSWTLTAGAGTKTVYVQYKDRAGNISAAASDTITYRP